MTQSDRCLVCGDPMRPWPGKACCSGRCRAAKSRRARVPVKAEDARVLREALITLLDAAWELKVTLEDFA